VVLSLFSRIGDGAVDIRTMAALNFHHLRGIAVELRQNEFWAVILLLRSWHTPVPHCLLHPCLVHSATSPGPRRAAQCLSSTRVWPRKLPAAKQQSFCCDPPRILNASNTNPIQVVNVRPNSAARQPGYQFDAVIDIIYIASPG